MNAPLPKSSSYGNVKMEIYSDIINLIGEVEGFIRSKDINWFNVLKKFSWNLVNLVNLYWVSWGKK
jgi:hypothetical protein